MSTAPDKIKAWQMVQPTARNKETGETIPGRLELAEIPVPDLKEGEVLVEVAGCGLCHTDLGYFYDWRAHGLQAAPDPGTRDFRDRGGGRQKWVGKEVLVPAVMPCRQLRAVQDPAGKQVPQSENARKQHGHIRRFCKPHSGSRL